MLEEGEEGKESWEMTQEKGNGEAASDQTSLDLVGCGWILSFCQNSYAG